MRLIAATLALLCLLLPATAAPKFPALTGRVVDDANILSSQTKADLNTKLAALEQKTSRQLVVVTIPSLGGYEISDYGYQLGRAWGLGQKTLNNGILLIVAPNEHKTRIEVGYGLEPILTDAFSSVIIQTQVLPKFRSGDFNGGVVAGTDALIQQLSLETSEAEKRAAAAAQQRGNDVQMDGPSIAGLVIFLIIAFIFFHFFGGWWLIPLLLSGGGGGSFGGGGSSGSW
jgi:uncharacterized protein